VKKLTIIGFVALFTVTCGLAGKGEDPPSVLFVPELHNVSKCAIDLNYVNELHSRGFAVDYLHRTSEFNWDRIRKYNCLVIYDIPYPEGHGEHWGGPNRKEFIELVSRYIESGGGVFLIKAAYHGDDNILPLLSKWDARIPYEVLRQDVNFVQFPQMNLATVGLGWTDDVTADTPVSEGVRRIYYPLKDHYDGSETAAILVGEPWQVVYRAPAEAISIPVQEPRPYFSRPEHALVRDPPVKAPPLFAIRSLGKGRIAFTSTWATWSMGSGTSWLYDRHILTKGWNGVPSDFQKLLDNTYRWLAEPSLGGDAIGGYRQDSQSLLPTNLQDKVREDYREQIPNPKQYVAQAESRNVVKGIYGPKSNYGGGSGTVEQWAKSARDAGLGFIVFMDEFAKLTPATLKNLQEDCRKFSAPDLSLIPGYAMDTTIGDHFFVYGPGDALQFPNERSLAGKDRTLFNMQFQDADGNFGKGNACLNWILRAKNVNMNFGYYRFSDGSGTMRMYDMRAYSVAAVRTYENSRLMEDVTEDFLTTVAATISPLPVTVNILHHPKELAAQAGKDIMHTYCLARGADTVFEDGLQYAHQYSGSPVFSSNGPVVRSWMNCIRPPTYGTARFAPGRTFAPAFLWVESDVGLKSIKLYDGPQLFRRFDFEGEKEVRRTLQLSSTLHRNVVLIAEDLRGGKAVTFPLRVYKPNTSAAFCSDQVNDCGNTYLGRGIGITQSFRTPATQGGVSWDGGPGGKVTLLPCGIQPRLKSNLGKEGHRQFANVPYLVFADEAGNGFRSHRTRVYDPSIEPINPWYTYGPMLASRLIDVDVHYGEWHRASRGAQESGWAAHPVRIDALPSLFELDIVSKKDQSIESIQLLSTGSITPPGDLFLLSFRDGRLETCRETQIFPSIEESISEHTIGTGDWAGLYSPKNSCGLIWYNRGAPLRFKIDVQGASQRSSFHYVPEETDFPEGGKLHYELFSLVYPLSVAEQGLERFRKTVAFFRELDGVKIIEGTRSAQEGPVDIVADNYRVHLTADKPAWDLATALPVRVSGLNANWSAGYYQLKGFAMGIYGDGSNKYHPCGFDSHGNVKATLYHCLADETEAIIGHPVVCDSKDLIIQVTQKPKSGGGYGYYVAVNNPTDKTIRTTLKRNLPLPDLQVDSRKLTVPPGGYVVVSEG